MNENRQPKVSVIVPIYNVEKYLRECLESILGQTLSDIEIILVNDGSKDGSAEIIREYAEKDPRIKVIDRENGGGGTARNAAYPYIEGKYVYFADPDDRLELELCEKAVQRIEETDAEVVCFRAVREFPDGKTRPVVRFHSDFPEIRVFPEHRVDLLRFCDAPWLKVWRSDFMLSHQIRFSEGKRPHNDVVHSWKGFALADKIAILNLSLYHSRRSRPGSYQTTLDRSHLVIVETMCEVEKALREVGKFGEYRHILFSQKFQRFYRKYIAMPNEYRSELGQLILESLSDDDRSFLGTATSEILPYKIRSFYKMLDKQDFFGTAIFQFHDMLAKIEKRLKTA